MVTLCVLSGTCEPHSIQCREGDLILPENLQMDKGLMAENLRICNTFNEIVWTDGRRRTGGTVDSSRVILYRHWSAEHLLGSPLSSWEEKRRQEVKEILPKECHQLRDKHLQPCPGGEISDPQPDSVSPFVPQSWPIDSPFRATRNPSHPDLCSHEIHFIKKPASFVSECIS